MADNVTVSNAPASSNTDIPVRTSELTGGKHVQHFRLDLGSGTTDGVISDSVPINDNGGVITVDGTVAATQSGTWNVTNVSGTVSLPTGAATESTLSTLNGKVTACNTGAVTVSAALPAGTNAIGKLAANSGVDIGDVDVTSIAAGDNNIGNVDIVTVPTDPFGANADSASATGSISAKLRFIASTGIPITGTVAVQAAGDIAHDSGDSGNPVKVGYKALSAIPTKVDANDRVNGCADLFGRQLIAEIDPAMQIWKSANYTTTQTGAVIWDPTSGKKIAITHFTIGTYATTAARLILWFGANGDSTYSAGSDQLVFAGSFVPSATATPGAIICPRTPIFCVTADHELHLTTDAGLSVDICVYGYEWA